MRMKPETISYLELHLLSKNQRKSAQIDIKKSYRFVAKLIKGNKNQNLILIKTPSKDFLLKIRYNLTIIISTKWD